MINTAIKAATYENLLELPEHIIGEIINGRIETHPRPATKHALASSALGGELFFPFQKGKGGPGGWWIIDEPELHLDSHVLVPDLAGWKKENMSILPDTAWFEVVPDWICEILSPSTAKIDRVEKMPIYAHLGVSHFWLIDPQLQTLEVYELHRGQWVLLETIDNDKAVSIAPFQDISFPLSSLWGE